MDPRWGCPVELRERSYRIFSGETVGCFPHGNQELLPFDSLRSLRAGIMVLSLWKLEIFAS